MLGIQECLPTRNSLGSQSANFMRRYFSTATAKSTSAEVTRGPCASTSGLEMAADDSNRGPDSESALPESLAIVGGTIFTGYASDLESESDESVPSSDSSEENNENDQPFRDGCESSGIRAPEFPVSEPPQLKRRIPKRIARHNAKESHRRKLEAALKDIEKVIASKLTQFQAGRNGLQEYRARAVRSYLHMVVKNGRKRIDASRRAAESQGFSANWGSRLVRTWARAWVDSRALPKSDRGRHVKSYTLLSDPAIQAELRSYLRSNKWAVNRAKLVEFTKNKMIPEAAKKYGEHIVNEEMPRGLKRYMELELFPRIHLKVGKGVSLETARQFLRKEGFQFMEHKKGLYYDGHERPDVVEYRQKVFLPAMEEYRKQLVEYEIGDVSKEVQKLMDGPTRRLVLVAQDEMTVQANDGKKKSWVLDGEQPLRKKGVGRGIHQSDVICSTYGWLKDASQSLEYGKNYDGYWTGELFVKQVSIFNSM